MRDTLAENNELRRAGPIGLLEAAMSPLLQRTLEAKAASRQRLAALPYPEKVRNVEQM